MDMWLEATVETHRAQTVICENIKTLRLIPYFMPDTKYMKFIVADWNCKCLMSNIYYVLQ